jgi:hypothetical protein
MAGAICLGPELVPLRRRIRLLIAEQCALKFGGLAALLALAPVILDKLRWLRFDWPIALSLITAGTLAGWLWGRFRPLTDFDIARIAESRLGLKERLSSAVALEAGAAQAPLVAALLEDASRHIAPLRPEQVFPRRFSRYARLFLAGLLLLAGAIVLPELPMFHSAAARRERAELRKQGDQLVALSRKLERTALPPDMEKLRRQLAYNLRALGKDLQNARIDRKQALLRFNKLEKQINLAEKQLTPGASEKSLSQAALQMKTGQQALDKMRAAQRASLLSRISAAKAQAGKPGAPLTEDQINSLEALAEKLKESTGGQLLDLDQDLASALAELLAKGDTKAALAIMQKLAEKLQEAETLKQLSPEELKQLAEELKQLAESLKNTDLDELAKELLETAKALERGDLKLCENCSGNLKKLTLGLSDKHAAKFRLAILAAGLGSCRGGLQGRGVGPGNGNAIYDPNAAHQVNQGAPTRIPAKHYDTKITGQQGDTGESYSVEILGEPDQPGKARVPYYQVYSGYEKTAENALDREEVPAPYREKVKDYFTSLKPGDK